MSFNKSLIKLFETYLPNDVATPPFSLLVGLLLLDRLFYLSGEKLELYPY
jgi:hypothetical protein